MSDDQNNSGPSPSVPSSLPPEAIELASRMYNAARQGDKELLTQAISAGLPPNLTNDKGDTLVCMNEAFWEVTSRAGPFHTRCRHVRCAVCVRACSG